MRVINLAGNGQVKRYPKLRAIIHDSSKPPRLGSYTPPKLYLLERIEGAALGRMGSVAGESGQGAAQRDPAQADRLGGRGTIKQACGNLHITTNYANRRVFSRVMM